MRGRGRAPIFDGASVALKITDSELRLFGKPESFVKCRMGVALARGADVAEARVRAKAVAGAVKPRAVAMLADAAERR